MSADHVQDARKQVLHAWRPCDSVASPDGLAHLRLHEHSQALSNGSNLGKWLNQ